MPPLSDKKKRYLANLGLWVTPKRRKVPIKNKENDPVRAGSHARDNVRGHSQDLECRIEGSPGHSSSRQGRLLEDYNNRQPEPAWAEVGHNEEHTNDDEHTKELGEHKGGYKGTGEDGSRHGCSHMGNCSEREHDGSRHDSDETNSHGEVEGCHESDSTNMQDNIITHWQEGHEPHIPELGRRDLHRENAEEETEVIEDENEAVIDDEKQWADEDLHDSEESSGQGEDRHSGNGSLKQGTFTPSPDLASAKSALSDITGLLRPPRSKGAGYKDPGFDRLLRTRLETMKMMLWDYIDESNSRKWTAASLHVAHMVQRGPWFARQLRDWSQAYINDHENLPTNIYGTWNTRRSLLEHEDIAQELQLHLQSVGKYVKAEDLIHYLEKPDVKARLKIEKTISIRTAQRWMHTMSYRWTKTPSGQYVDGHERADVVAYRQNIFLPKMAESSLQARRWTSNGNDELIQPWPWDEDGGLRPFDHLVVEWKQDETTFFANDRRGIHWVHKSQKAVPRPKGEGASLMVSDFMSADYGWLRSPDGNEEARVLFKAGKGRDGYYTNDDIVRQTEKAMDILSKYYPQHKHRFIFDNAPTHLKRHDDALSARRMPKNESRPEFNFMVETAAVDDTGRPIYNTDGSLKKIKVPMANGRFSDGSPQSFYYPEEHPRAGIFKGMAVILEERGFHGASRLRAECPKFKCEVGATACCCRRILYNQPDFVSVESILETTCRARGFDVVFFPKFHCELNCIEQCWGYAKRVYRMYPPSSREVDLERNVLAALESVPLAGMRRFDMRSHRFMDAYRKGLTGSQAAWASKRYRGHRVLPEQILKELEEKGIN